MNLPHCGVLEARFSFNFDEKQIETPLLLEETSSPQNSAAAFVPSCLQLLNAGARKLKSGPAQKSLATDALRPLKQGLVTYPT